MKSKKSTCYQKKDSKLLLIKDCFRHKITNLLDTTSNNVPRFITKKWIEVHDQSRNAEDRYKQSKQIRFKTSMPGSDLCDFSDAYIVAKGAITLTKTNERGIIDIRNRFLAFKNNAPFANCIIAKCITHINDEHVDNADNLDIIMPFYNLIEFSDNYSDTTGSLWQFKRDESPVKNAGNPHDVSKTNSSSYKIQIKLFKTLTAADNGVFEDVEIAVPLKCLSNFWRSLEMPLINCKIYLELNWSNVNYC